MAITVALVNKSNLDDSEVESVAVALQRQVHEHLAPAWGVDADVVLRTADALRPDDWALVLTPGPPVDATDAERDAPAWHAIIKKGNLPAAFVNVAHKEANPWTVLASHELLEMLVNPWDDRAAASFDDDTRKIKAFVALEVADPVENEQYAIGGYQVCDFVYPHWFDSGVPVTAGTYLDHCNTVTHPFEVGKGSYPPAYAIGSSSPDWTFMPGYLSAP
jgi:hypothetical protein